ncbi:Luc7 protein [Martiniozyma asiatica (nom. inval.)]|nr:Luc7 protein [Martiniozyma asiatica]
MDRAAQHDIVVDLLGKSLNTLPSSIDPKTLRPVSSTTETINPRTCRSFLMGICPYEQLKGTKDGMGPCPGQHNEKDRLIFQIKLEENKDEDFENIRKIKEEHNRLIKKVIGDADWRIERDQLRDEGGDGTWELVRDEVDALLEAGDLEGVLKLGVILSDIKSGNKQKMQMCQDCGAMISTLDNDRRLADHYIGRLHMAYVRMRKYLATLQ